MRTPFGPFIWICMLAFCGGMTHVAHAEVTVTVNSVKGRVEYRNSTADSWKKVYRGARLRRNSFLRTYEGGEAVLVIGERGVVTVHELSTVMVSNLGGTERQPDARFRLLVGKIWAKWKKKSGDEEEEDTSRIDVTTPAAVASVRGTSWYVESDEMTKNTKVGVWDGQVLVGSLAAQGGKKVDAGFEIIVLFNKPLIDPRKMQIERIKSEQQFNEQIDSLGLAKLFAGATGAAAINETLNQEAEATIKEAAIQERGDKIVREDFDKFKQALAKLYADTGFMPGSGFNKAGGAKTLKCLVENDDGRGKAIDGWKGPYMTTDFKDPFGGEYGVYQKRLGSRRMMILVSLGLDKVISGDDIEKPYSEAAVKKDAEAYK